MSKKLFIGFVVSIVAVIFICAHGYSETMTFPGEKTDLEMIPFPEEGFSPPLDVQNETMYWECYWLNNCRDTGNTCGCDGNPYYTVRNYWCEWLCCTAPDDCKPVWAHYTECRHTSNCAH